MKVTIELKEGGRTIQYDTVKAAFQKGEMYCVLTTDGKLIKTPVAGIFRAIEEGGAPKQNRYTDTRQPRQPVGRSDRLRRSYR